MDRNCDRRHLERIRFSWPLWFGYDDNGEVFRGQIVDLAQNTISFTVNNQPVPSPGDHVFTRFSFPTNHSEDFAMGQYLHWSEVIRVQPTTVGSTHIAMRLHQPLNHDPSKPADKQILTPISA